MVIFFTMQDILYIFQDFRYFLFPVIIILFLEELKCSLNGWAFVENKYHHESNGVSLILFIDHLYFITNFYTAVTQFASEITVSPLSCIGRVKAVKKINSEPCYSKVEKLLHVNVVSPTLQSS